MKKHLILAVVVALVLVSGLLYTQSKTGMDNVSDYAKAQAARIPLETATPLDKTSVTTRSEADMVEKATKAGWVIECVHCPRIFRYMDDRSLALDAQGYPHIAYGAENLYYAWRDSAGWHYETVDEEDGVGFEASLALDGDGFPHISYFDSDHDSIKYAYLDNSGWHKSIVSTGAASCSSSLALDDAGNAHISYNDSSNGNLIYTYQDGSDWNTDIVDNDKYGFGSISLDLDAKGFPHISYKDDYAESFKYAYYSDELPTPTQPPTSDHNIFMPMLCRNG